MKVKHNILLAGMLVGMVVASTGIAADVSADKTAAAPQKIRIGWVYAMANAPLLVAQEKGFFKEAGVEVEIDRYDEGPSIRAGLMSGKVDLAYIGTPPVYHWNSTGLNAKIVAKVNYGQAAVIVRTDSGINDLTGLRNKKMAGVKVGSGMDVLLRGYVLSEAGKMNPSKDLEIQTMAPGNMGMAVENKVVAGAFIWEPFTSTSLAQGNTKVIMDVNKELPNYPWYVIMAMPDAMKSKRDGIVKVLKAHRKAVDFLNSNPTAGNDIIMKAFAMQAVKDKDGKEVSAETILNSARTRLGWQSELTQGDMDFIQKLMDYSHKLGYIKQPMKATDVVDNSLMAEAKK